jgi:Zn-dependent protease with chaperone function
MQTVIQGYYLDGQTADRQPAQIFPIKKGLQIQTEKCGVFFWPYKEIRQTERFHGDQQIRLERGGETPEILLVPGLSFLMAVRWADAKQARKFRRPSLGRNWLMVSLAAAVGILGIAAGLYLWGIPALSSLVAPYVPVSWEESLGKSVAESFAPPEKRCLDPERDRAIEQVVATLTSSLDRCPYTFRVVVVDHSRVNALAAPGGTIIVYRGLLERTQTAEELAGVLAHEMQHILLRHSTRALLQRASMGILLAALMGDANGAMAFGLESAGSLGMLRYSRKNEEEADAKGMQLLLAAGIDPRGMITFYEKLKKQEKKASLPEYLSSHPSMEKRIERLKSLASRSRKRPIKLLADQDWAQVKGICQGPQSH